MAKVSYSKLKIKVDTSHTILTHKVDEDTSYDIEVLNYLTIEDKLKIITNVIINSANEQKFYNPALLEVFLSLEIVQKYTNIGITEKQLENPAKLYDELISSGLMDDILNILDENTELEWLENTLDDTVRSIYQYQNSVIGIVDSVTERYQELGGKMDDLNTAFANPENLALLKKILTKFE